MIEIWKPIKGFEGKYEVSNLGNVRYIKPTVLKCSVNGSGYAVVSLHPDNAKTSKSFSVHKLVAEAFYGEQPKGSHIAHWNGLPSDNRVENLRYATPKENVGDDRRRHGRLPLGVKNYQSKFGEQTVRRIMILKGFVKSTVIAAALGVDKSVIQRIWSGKNWSHVNHGKDALA